jgi:hypothetical protein
MLSHRRWRRKRRCGDLGRKRARAVGPRGARGRGERDDVICVAGGGSTAAAASDGAKRWRRLKTKKKKKKNDGLLGFI